MKFIRQNTNSIDSGLIEHYLNEGFLILPKFFSVHQGLLDSFCNRLKKYTGIVLEKNVKHWTSNELHTALINLRKNTPKLFGLMYDEMNLQYELRKIFFENRLANIVSTLMQIQKHSLVYTGHMLRLDSPIDSRNSLKWHQDQSYYPQNNAEEAGLVIWYPIIDVSKENGTLQIIPGSHKIGTRQVSSKAFGPNHSEQFEITEKDLKSLGLTNIVDFEAEAGDVGFFHMNLIHRSGNNKSGKFRIVAGCGAHNSSSHHFKVGIMQYILS